jgi:catechol 2,3-dioxygenase-like lactoylglutathione lyase family enzyme
MAQRLALIALLVREYDEAIAFYVGKLGFELLEDSDLGNKKRWVRVAPPGSQGSALLLARAVNDDQRAAVGRQCGGRVFLFLETDDFARDYELYRSRGVTFVRAPVREPYGVVAVMADLYGNPIDLIERYPLASARG